jgi:hypothetical protein
VNGILPAVNEISLRSRRDITHTRSTHTHTHPDERCALGDKLRHTALKYTKTIIIQTAQSQMLKQTNKKTKNFTSSHQTTMFCLIFKAFKL